MKTIRQLILLIFIAGLISCGHGPTKEVTVKFNNGKPKFIRTYPDKENDPLTYFTQQFYENGQLEGEGLLKNKLQEGPWIWYWENGKIKDKAEFKNGKYINKRIHYYENGQLKKEEFLSADGCPPENCDCVEKIIHYYPNGQIHQVNQTVKGKINGTLTTYYSNGKKEFESNFSLGIKNGDFSEWDSLGTLTSKEIFINDSLIKKIK